MNLARHDGLFADDVRIAVKMALPERIADYDHPRGVRLFIVARKTATEKRTCAEHFKNIRSDCDSGDILRIFASPPDGGSPGVCGHRGESMILRAEIQVIGIGMHLAIIVGVLQRRSPDHR